MEKIIYSLVVAVAIGAAAQLSIPLPEGMAVAPITGQSLAIFIGAYLLGRVYGSFAVLLYLTLGGLGLPLFADFSGGFEKLSGPAAGYFAGFIVSAYLIGWWSEKKAGFGKNFLYFLTASIVLLVCGMLGLLRYYDLKAAFFKGVVPFLPGALIKVLLAAILISLISRFKSLMNQDELKNR